MTIRKNLNNHHVFKYYIIIFIIQIFISLIKNEEVGDCNYSDSTKTCSSTGLEVDCSDVRPRYEDKKCYKCTGNANNFYKILSNGTCENLGTNGCENKIIFETYA